MPLASGSGERGSAFCRTNRWRIASAIRGVIHGLKIAVSLHTVLEYAENKAMRAGGFGLFRPPCWIRVSGCPRKFGRRKWRCGCCFYSPFYSPSPRSSLKYVDPSPVAKATLSATLMTFARSAGRLVGDLGGGDFSKAPRPCSGSARLVPSLNPNPRGLSLKQMY
jgi:hypothetical protein